MNRKKAILAIFMMAFLIIIGFVFPSIWKSQKGNKKSETENTQHDNNENTETEQAENNESISFQDFEALEDFFSKEQVKLFQEELTSYLKNVKQMSLTSIRFLADDTTYPNASDINFSFQLPDKSVLPVYYTSSTGRFFFGEERTPDFGKEIIYLNFQPGIALKASRAGNLHVIGTLNLCFSHTHIMFFRKFKSCL